MSKTLLAILLALASFALLASALQSPDAKQEASSPIGTITTLYANDPLECSLDLLTGKPGLVAQEGELLNHDSHLCMGYYPDSLAAGIQGGDTAAIVDLGTAQEVAKASSTKVLGNGGNVFVALGPAWIRKQAGLQKTVTIAHAPIKAGHIYLVRIAGEGKPEIFAKLLVLEFQPGESVTLRWQRIEG